MPLQKHSRLLVTTRVLIEISQSCSFGPRFLVGHLSDFLAAMLQLCYAPLRKPASEAESALLIRMLSERDEISPAIISLLHRAYPPLLIKVLLLLQGPLSPPTSSAQGTTKPVQKKLSTKYPNNLNGYSL